MDKGDAPSNFPLWVYLGILCIVGEQRATWSRHLEFIVTCVGYAVGLGNVWRFPYMCFQNGGGAFLIPYFACLFVLGLPIFFMEISFGQFAGIGTISAWEINPLFKGLGYSMVMVSVVIGIYYPTIIASAVYFMLSSMQDELPWASCDHDWNTCYCRDENDAKESWTNSRGLNCSGLILNEQTQTSASHEFYYKKVLAATESINDPGGIKWDLTSCNLFIWCIVFFSIIKGVKSMGKVGYVAALFPYVLMTALLVKGLTLDGAYKGIAFYMDFDFSKVMNSQVWRAAGSQIFFSLSCCMGGLVAMSSYNDFNTNTVRDTFLISFINCGTSLYAGFAIFATLGYMAEISGKSVADVAMGGPGLVFVAYPTALAKMPFAQMWSVFFFLMMVLLGLGTQLPIIETVCTALQDEFLILRRSWNNILFRGVVCVLGFLMGLPLTTRGGIYVLNVYDTFIQLPLLLVGLVEIIAIIWVYGIPSFSEDMMLMVGYSKYNRIIYNFYFRYFLLIFAPLFIFWITIYNIIDYTPISAGKAYPPWAEAVGWFIVFCIMGWTPIWYFFNFCRRGGYGLLKSMNKPTPKWGPSDPSRWTIPRYQAQLNVQQADVQPPAGGNEGVAVEEKPKPEIKISE